MIKPRRKLEGEIKNLIKSDFAYIELRHKIFVIYEIIFTPFVDNITVNQNQRCLINQLFHLHLHFLSLNPSQNQNQCWSLVNRKQCRLLNTSFRRHQNLQQTKEYQMESLILSAKDDPEMNHQ